MSWPIARTFRLFVSSTFLDLIGNADWVVDLGPGAGPKGGDVVAMGRPEDVAKVPESVTGRYLKAILSKAVSAA